MRAQSRISALDLGMALAAMAGALLLIFAAAQAEAQTFQVLHNFTGGQDGGEPAAGLTMDAAGSLYGTTYIGGYTAGNCYGSCGTVFRLKRAGQSWVLNSLYLFRGGNDGANPGSRVVFGPDHSLYGMTWTGGGESCPTGNIHGCGTVYNLRPSPTACATVLCPWRETVLYRFAGGPYDGATPSDKPVFDSAGNMYGTTYEGGTANDYVCFGTHYTCGTVFEMSPSNGGWTEGLIYKLTGEADGSNPDAHVTFDANGNLYGTTSANGYPNIGGTVFELTPSGAGWSENTLFDFSYIVGDSPRNGLIFDAAGNLYGATPFNGPHYGGVVFELQASSGGWTFAPLYNFSGNDQTVGPNGDLLMDSAGNLYGTVGSLGTYNKGLVFELSPTMYGWSLTVLHEFTGQDDGAFPTGGVVLDAQGNLYGTAESGGSYNQGVVWEITP